MMDILLKICMAVILFGLLLIGFTLLVGLDKYIDIGFGLFFIGIFTVWILMGITMLVDQ